MIFETSFLPLNLVGMVDKFKSYLVGTTDQINKWIVLSFKLCFGGH